MDAARYVNIARMRRSVLAACLAVPSLLLVACGGGGGDAAAPASSATASLAQVDNSVVSVAAAAPPTVPLQAPPWPRSSISANELAVVVIAGDALSEAIGEEYRRQRNIPAENLVRVSLPTGSALVSEADFGRAKAQFDAQAPARIQASLLAFARPSRVVGARCTMSITSAMAFGYSPAWCGGCAETQASPYFDAETTHPWDDLRMRPSMMLPAQSLAEAQAWMARGLAAGTGTEAARALLVRTADSARSVRYPDMAAASSVWRGSAELDVQYVDMSEGNSVALADAAGPLMFHFTGATRVADKGHRWLPGAVADHLTSYGGMLPDANGQMPITDWLVAGATASYGTVEEPCNYLQKFPRVSVLIDHYMRGATVLEAYWKSVAWPGQGLFVGDPLARPFADEAVSQVEADGWLSLQTRSWRRGGQYQLQWRAGAEQAWTTLHQFVGGAPVPARLRMALPASTGQLRWSGPCPMAGGGSCEFGAPLS